VRRVAVAGLAVLLLASSALAQQAQVSVPGGPHYVGTSIEIQVVATGFEEEPAPEPSVPTPSRGRLDFIDVQPSTSESIMIVNGRATRTKEVRFVYRYRYLANAPGRVEIGPFTLAQAGVQRTTQVVRLQVGELALSDRIEVRIELPESRVFVGQRVPVALEFWLEKDLQKNLHRYVLQAPLFERIESFHFVDEPDPAATTDVDIETASGALRLRGTAREEIRGRERFFVVRIVRTMIPLRAGSVEVEPSSLVVDEATRWSRDFFGGRRATHVRKLRALDRARTLAVGAVPLDGRPESFAGAVGRGYSLEVSVDRSVVQVGDPITLTLTLRGEGNLEVAGLPPLSAKGLLDPMQFRVPAGDLPGRLEGDAKRFSAVVRVQDEEVSEIPALEYSWFDAETQSFQTTRSRPIALSVRAAEVVSAADVVSGEVEEGRDAPSAGAAELPAAARETGAVLTLTGADLAIERDVAKLARGASSQQRGWTVLAGIYFSSCLLLGIAIIDRKRRAVDPTVVELRKHLETQSKRIRAAAKLPGREGAQEVADAIRQMLAKVPEARSAEIESFLGECDALIYAPGEAPAASSAELREQAVTLADGISGRAQ
jgi:hypothetical protein